MAENISINFILEGTKKNKDGKYPIKLNIYNKEIGQKRIGTKLSVSKADWERIDSGRLRDENLKTLKIKLDTIRKKAVDIIDGMDRFSFAAFEAEYYANNTAIASSSENLQNLFDVYISKLKANGQIGSASSYRSAINSINDFKKNLSIFDITPAWLQSYENHLKAKDKSVSTIGIYMRQLRAIINIAINDGILPPDKYPFKKYQVPSGRNVKKALSNNDLKKIIEYCPENENQKKALDFWKLSYYCFGINFTDIAHLKKENFDGKFFSFFREKTKRTKKRDLRPIQVAVNKDAQEIIERYWDENDTNPYLFGILEPGLSSVTIKHRCQRFIKWVNKYMEEVRIALNIDQKVGTYAARHSFSTTLMRKGVPISFIKDSLGHSSVVTTENYLDSFEDEIKVKYADLLIEI